MISPPLTVICCSASGLVGRAVHHAAVLDREGAAVALAVDVAVRDRADDAALVGADGREALELALGRLGDHDLLVVEDRAAADLDVGRSEDSVPPDPPVSFAVGAVAARAGGEDGVARARASPGRPAYGGRGAGWGRAVMRATVRIADAPPNRPGVLGPELTEDPQRPHADLRAAFLARRLLGRRLRGAFVAAVFAAGAFRARLAGFGCFASRPSSNGLRKEPV